jgi:sugar phosphate isomerase/epimerase
MQLILFSKFLKDKDVPGLIETARRLGLDGYDLAVRDGYVVNPGNVKTELAKLVKALAKEKLAVPMVTGPGDLVRADHPAAAPIIAAAGEAGVKHLKLGYGSFYPEKNEDYWRTVDAMRRDLAAWEALGRKHGVKVCYHTHSATPHCHMGINCCGLMHFLRGFDPNFIGAYIDPGHMTNDGEPFAIGVAIVKPYLALVALKDVLIAREESTQSRDEGTKSVQWVAAGEGCVPWSAVFAELIRVGFDGPLSIHAEFENAGPDDFAAKLEREVAYFRRKLAAALASRT